MTGWRPKEGRLSTPHLLPVQAAAGFGCARWPGGMRCRANNRKRHGAPKFEGSAGMVCALSSIMSLALLPYTPKTSTLAAQVRWGGLSQDGPDPPATLENQPRSSILLTPKLRGQHRPVPTPAWKLGARARSWASRPKSDAGDVWACGPQCAVESAGGAEGEVKSGSVPEPDSRLSDASPARDAAWESEAWGSPVSANWRHLKGFGENGEGKDERKKPETCAFFGVLSALSPIPHLFLAISPTLLCRGGALTPSNPGPVGPSKPLFASPRVSPRGHCSGPEGGRVGAADHLAAAHPRCPTSPLGWAPRCLRPRVPEECAFPSPRAPGAAALALRRCGQGSPRKPASQAGRGRPPRLPQGSRCPASLPDPPAQPAAPGLPFRLQRIGDTLRRPLSAPRLGASGHSAEGRALWDSAQLAPAGAPGLRALPAPPPAPGIPPSWLGAAYLRTPNPPLSGCAARRAAGPAPGRGPSRLPRGKEAPRRRPSAAPLPPPARTCTLLYRLSFIRA